MKTMKVAGQILILWNAVKNDLDSNEYQRENRKKNPQIKYLQNNSFCSHIARWSLNGLE